VSKLQHQRKQAKEKGERGPVQIPSKGRGERFTACPITTSWRTGERPRNQEAGQTQHWKIRIPEAKTCLLPMELKSLRLAGQILYSKLVNSNFRTYRETNLFSAPNPKTIPWIQVLKFAKHKIFIYKTEVIFIIPASQV
jgi:hypothetical protein